MIYECFHIRGDVWEWEVCGLAWMGQGETDGQWEGESEEGKYRGRGRGSMRYTEHPCEHGGEKARVTQKAWGLPDRERHKSSAQSPSLLLPGLLWVSGKALPQEHLFLALSFYPGSCIWVHLLLPFCCHVNRNRKPSFDVNPLPNQPEHSGNFGKFTTYYPPCHCLCSSSLSSFFHLSWAVHTSSVSRTGLRVWRKMAQQLLSQTILSGNV